METTETFTSIQINAAHMCIYSAWRQMGISSFFLFLLQHIQKHNIRIWLEMNIFFTHLLFICLIFLFSFLSNGHCNTNMIDFYFCFQFLELFSIQTRYFSYTYYFNNDLMISFWIIDWVLISHFWMNFFFRFTFCFVMNFFVLMNYVKFNWMIK